MKQTIYVVDDHRLMREALAILIEDEQDLELCGTAETASEALGAVPEMNPDLVLVDISLPGMNGIELIERLLASNPLQRILVLSGHTEPVYAERALAAGAKGYILKGEPLVIIEALRRVLDGKVFVSPSMRSRMRQASRTEKEMT